MRLDPAPDKGSGVSLASGVFARDGIERTAPVHCIATDPRLAGYAAPASQTGGRACRRGRPTADRASAERHFNLHLCPGALQRPRLGLDAAGQNLPEEGSFGVCSSWIGEYCDALSMAIVRGSSVSEIR